MIRYFIKTMNVSEQCRIWKQIRLIHLFVLALRRLRGCDVQSSELDEILQEQADTKGLRPRRPWELFSDRSVRWQLISVMIISSAMQLCGNDSVRGAAIIVLIRQLSAVWMLHNPSVPVLLTPSNSNGVQCYFFQRLIGNLRRSLCCHCSFPPQVTLIMHAGCWGSVMFEVSSRLWLWTM